MTTIEVDDALTKMWPLFDQVFEMLGDVAEIRGVSCADISRAFTALTTSKPWGTPSFMVWACVKHSATSYGDLKDRLTS